MFKTFSSTKFGSGLIFLMLLAACQRDDLCPETTNTTPMLVINFYDDVTREERTSLNLTVREVGRETLDTLLYRENSTSIRIPLHTDRDSTKYEFIYNAPIYDEDGEVVDDPDNELETNTDILEFRYRREEEYINRACSFKINFLGISTRRIDGSDGGWIQQFERLTDDITSDTFTEDDPNDAHFNLYFR